MAESLFELNNVRKYFGDREIFHAPSLELFQGNIYAIVGPNGSGKTTILKILNALEKPSSGTVLFKGTDLHNTPDASRLQRDMTLVMQNPLLFNTTVYKNVAYGLKLRNMAKEHIKRTVEATLELVGLSHITERKVANLSGGEVQRVAIARALAINPRVFFLDEPTANVDQMNIKLIEEIILGLRKQNKSTVIMTTHNPTQAYLLADTVFSIIDGRVTEAYYENIFQGEIKATDGVKLFTKNNIQICLVTDKTGRAIISVDPREIIISSAPLHSSARNSFNGKVIKISELKAQIKVVVDIGLDIAVIITQESCAEMGFTIGSGVFVTFKSSSVQVY